MASFAVGNNVLKISGNNKFFNISDKKIYEKTKIKPVFMILKEVTESDVEEDLDSLKKKAMGKMDKKIKEKKKQTN